MPFAAKDFPDEIIIALRYDSPLRLDTIDFLARTYAFEPTQLGAHILDALPSLSQNWSDMTPMHLSSKLTYYQRKKADALNAARNTFQLFLPPDIAEICSTLDYNPKEIGAFFLYVMKTAEKSLAFSNTTHYNLADFLREFRRKQSMARRTNKSEKAAAPEVEKAVEQAEAVVSAAEVPQAEPELAAAPAEAMGTESAKPAAPAKKTRGASKRAGKSAGKAAKGKRSEKAAASEVEKTVEQAETTLPAAEVPQAEPELTAAPAEAMGTESAKPVAPAKKPRGASKRAGKSAGKTAKGKKSEKTAEAPAVVEETSQKADTPAPGKKTPRARRVKEAADNVASRGRPALSKEEKKARADARRKAKGVKADIVIQYQGVDVNEDELAEKAKAIFLKAHKTELITDMKGYLVPEQRAIYYVINGETIQVDF